MNGDLTRSTFDAARNYSAVRAQQGRVMLDADTNEQTDIALRDTREGRVDLVGGSGAPADSPGFGITVAGSPVLGTGRYLVDGIRVENTDELSLAAAQPFLPESSLPTAEGAWLAYLEVWERPLTAVEEPSIREVALGGPDTTLRDQVVWQVRWLRLGNSGAGNCESASNALDALDASFDGTLRPRLEPSGASGPCIVSEASSYRGLENQLYRLEIHAGNIGPDGAAIAQAPTVKWSRDNGAIVASAIALTSSSPVRLQIDRLGPGGAAGFDIGTSVEIRNEADVLVGRPGILARVDDVEADTLELTLQGGATVAALQGVLAGARAVVRRWDSPDAVAVANAWTAVDGAGLEVRFNAGGRFRTGDFWLIPARTAPLPGTGQQLDWPETAPGSGTFITRRSQGPARHRAALAILDRSAGGVWSLRSDCRWIFPPLTSLWTITSAGGDGQHGRGGEWLPAPITAVVTRGSEPVAGARLLFRVTSGGGGVTTSAPSAAVPPGEVEVTTSENGHVAVYWRLGAGPASSQAADLWEPQLAQTVEVVRLGPAGTPIGAPISFVASALDHLNLHMVGGNAQQGRPGETLEVALRVRIDDGHRPVENAVVEFSVLNRVWNRQVLNQDTGGTVHASARFVSGQAWAGGTRHHTVRTYTDAAGVAQVQWTLGTLLDLTTQRVEARLVNRAGTLTQQRGIFTAQLALAGEITWQPLVPWLAALLGTPNQTVQGAIDALAQRLEQSESGAATFNPFLALRWRDTQNQINDLGVNASLPLSNFAALVFRNDLVPSGRDLSQLSAHAGVRVYAEVPSDDAGITTVVRLGGTFRRSGGTWQWTLSSDARSSLSRQMGSASSVQVRVSVVPRWLPGGRDTDSTTAHDFVFGLRRLTGLPGGG
ncbi:MAG: DUF6519 domain-containing protein [Polyangiaceae bacterium]